MNKIKYILILASGLLAFSSCAFLTEKSLTEIDKNEYINDADEAESVLNGVYRTLVEDGAYAMNLSFFLNMGTDISQVEGSSTENWRIVPTNAFPTTQSQIQET